MSVPSGQQTTPDDDGTSPRVMACYQIAARPPFRLLIDRGSVVDFSYPPNPRQSAVAIAYAGGILTGHGAAGAVFDAGGPELAQDRQRALRRHTGPRSAVCTGPSDAYGRLNVPYVIHANAPPYGHPTEGDSLSSSYMSSLECGKDERIEAIAFSLFGAGYYGPSRNFEWVLKIAMSTILRFDGYEELKEVHLFAFTEMEAGVLMNIAVDMGLQNLVSGPESNGLAHFSLGELGGVLEKVDDAMSAPSGQQPSETPTNNNDDSDDAAISQFLAFTGASDPSVARQYLEMSGNHVETAVGLFMDHAAPSDDDGPGPRVMACYQIAARQPFRLVIDRGSVVDFSYPPNPRRSAIVIRRGIHTDSGESEDVKKAGGPTLQRDRQRALRRDTGPGTAVCIGPNDAYGRLAVPYVINANAPTPVPGDRSGDSLSSAYMSSLECGKKEGIEAIAFSLFAAGYYGPSRNFEWVLRIAMSTILLFDGYEELKEVHLFAFTDMEAGILTNIAVDMGLQNLVSGPESNSLGGETMSYSNLGWARRKKSGMKTKAASLIQSTFRSRRCQPEVAERKTATSEQTCEDEASLDALAICAKKAAKRMQLSIQFVPRPDGLVPPEAELLLSNHPSSAISDLTMHTYWRQDERTIATKATLPPIPAAPEDDINNTRKRLSMMSESTVTSDPIQLPPAYIEEIKTETLIGKGYYGKVVLGLDSAIRQQFAIKLIDPLVIEQSLSGLCAGRLESIQRTFRNEVKVLTQLRHPNICPLYGYCMPERGLANTCLLYELAINGSLDRFWKDRLGRERLSDARVRARIAFEVATVLRYMHEGLDGGAKCFHRDIKSANICLTADFRVRVVDCGLSKYVTEQKGSFSSAGPTGTPGYTCPEYLLGGTTFTSACDVFSFGVLLCDLITGKTSCQQAQHYFIYRKSKAKHRSLEGDADECVDWGEDCLRSLAKLSSKCMRSTSSDRPSIGRVVHTLQQILNGFDNSSQSDTDHSSSSGDRLLSKSSDLDESMSSNSSTRRCRLCGEDSNKCVQCTGTGRHIHCHNCVESSLTRDINKFRYDGLTCLKEGCDSNELPDEAVASIVSRDVWGAYSLQRSRFSMEIVADSASKCVWDSYLRKQDMAIASMENRVINVVEQKFRQMHELQVKLSAGNGLPCPKLFYLVEADTSASWRQPREWAKNAGSVKLYLYFVCSHSLERVSDKCRIKLRYSRDWLKSIAPALNMSLDVLMLSVGMSLGRECPLDFAKIKDLDEWAKDLLDIDEMSLFEEAKSRDGSDRGVESERSLQTLVGNSLSCVAEKAASSNISWQSELVPVFDSVTKEPTFVKSRFASEPRYQTESEIMFTP